MIFLALCDNANHCLDQLIDVCVCVCVGGGGGGGLGGLGVINFPAVMGDNRQLRR